MRACWRKAEACNNRANARHLVAWGRKEAVRLLLSACAAIALITSCASPFSYMSHHIDPGNGDEQTLTGVHCLGLTVISCPPAQPIVSCGSQSRTWQCEDADTTQHQWLMKTAISSEPCNWTVKGVFLSPPQVLDETRLFSFHALLVLPVPGGPLTSMTWHAGHRLAHPGMSQAEPLHYQ